MATKININDTAVKRHIKKGDSSAVAAAAMGIHPSTMADAYYRLEPVVDPTLVISGTPKQVAKQIVKLRNSGVRWERLAARSGLSYKAVKDVYTAESGVDADSTYTGKGRKYHLAKATPVRQTRPNTRKRQGKKAAA